MHKVCPLASGSSGNCTYIESQEAKILVDCGISCRQVVLRLQAIGVEVEELDAILLTHEHIDHVRGVAQMAKRFQIPLLANVHTAKAVVSQLDFLPKCKIFTTGESFDFLDLVIHPFSVQHDAVDPVGFRMTAGGISCGFCTDLGYATRLVRHTLQGCHYLLLESSYDFDLLWGCGRPLSVKQRISSRSGHLSNQESRELLQDLLHPDLYALHLGHLSQECNRPELALQEATEVVSLAGLQTRVAVALPDRPADQVRWA